jgi:hypothetical protein
VNIELLIIERKNAVQQLFWETLNGPHTTTYNMSVGAIVASSRDGLSLKSVSNSGAADFLSHGCDKCQTEHFKRKMQQQFDVYCPLG